MCKAITEKFRIINQRALAKKIDISISTLNRIVNNKQNCSKQMAFCIVKAIHSNAEIEDYFVIQRKRK